MSDKNVLSRQIGISKNYTNGVVNDNLTRTKGIAKLIGLVQNKEGRVSDVVQRLDVLYIGEQIIGKV